MLDAVKVLLQDLDDRMRAVIRPMLARPDTRVLEARDPWEAARVAEREAPDVVLLSAADVHYFGLDILDQLASRSPHARMLLLGAAQPRSRRAQRLPVDGYLPFPFNAAGLNAAIARVLAPSRQAVLSEV